MPPVWLLTLAAGVRVVLPMAALAVAGSGSLLVTEPGPDRYLSLAQWLARTGQFTSDGVTPELFRLPGYPVLLVPGVWLGWPMTYGLALNAAAGALTVALVWRAALLLGSGRAAALTAAVIVALDPVLVIWASRLMAESIFAALVAATGVAVIRVATSSRDRTTRRTRWREASILGVLLASMVYVRPVALAVPPMLLLGAMLHRVAGDRALLRVLGPATVVCALFLLPWVVRNGVVAGYWGLTTLPARGAYLAYGAAVEARSAGRPFRDERAQRVAEESRALRQHGVAAYRRMLGEGLASVVRQPAELLGIYAGGLVRTLVDPGGIEYVRLFGRYPLEGGLLSRVVRDGFVPTALAFARERPGTTAVTLAAGVPLLVLLVLAAAGFRELVRWHAGTAVLTGCLVAGLLIPAGGPHGNARFRLPATPVLGIWAAVALEARRQRRPQAVAGRMSEDPTNRQVPARGAARLFRARGTTVCTGVSARLKP